MLARFVFHFVRITIRLLALYALLIITVLSCALVIAGVEKVSFGEALYFSFITGLTIGYGDIVPGTVIGRITSVLLGFIGILFSGVVVGIAVQSVRYALEEMRSKSHPKLRPPV
jgi:voltage-gated potassium channel